MSMDKDDALAIIGIIALIALFCALVAAAFFIAGAVTYAAWNYGVCAFINMPHLDYIPACFIGLGVNLLRGGSK